jgi:hypothetical protein
MMPDADVYPRQCTSNTAQPRDAFENAREAASIPPSIVPDVPMLAKPVQ